MKGRMVEYSSYDSPHKLEEKSTEQQGEGASPNLGDTLISLRAEIISCKDDNGQLIETQERLAKAQYKQDEVDAVILQILSDLQEHGQLGTNLGERQEEKTNGAY